MNIEPSSTVKTNNTDLNKGKPVEKNQSKNLSFDPLDSAQIRQTIDEATGILQTIVSDQMSEKVIRKIPPDEYLQMLSLLDEMISGSIHKEV